MPAVRSARYWTLLGLTSIWLAALLLPPLAAHAGWPGAGLAYLPFSPICHQIPERSFLWLGQPLAVCHRCSGIYLGFWLGLILFPYWRALALQLWARPRLLLAFFLPMAINVMLDNTAASRFATGFAAGFPVSLFVWTAWEQFPPVREAISRRRHESR